MQQSTPAMIDRVRRSRKLKRFVRKGVPAGFRRDVWMVVSGAQSRLVHEGGKYARLLAETLEPQVADQIERDLYRTFPDHALFAKHEGATSEPPGVVQLRRVLRAYAAYNVDVGYCQGMNFIGGFLLVTLERDEEAAFWMLLTLINSYCRDFYVSNLAELRVEQEVLGELVRTRLPQVHAHFETLGFPLAAMTIKWLCTLFVDVLPATTVVHVWDCLLHEGTKVMFRVALALIQLHESKILAIHDLGELLHFFQRFPALILDSFILMDTAFEHVPSLSGKRIDELRQAVRAKQQQQTEAK